jgi:bifunctional non-homologous end joining protein LigD
MARATAKQTLSKYQEMRDFTRTAEPSGSKRLPRTSRNATPASLGYVIQKHAASRLHYDFRLELNGVLLSWAVPKGPSLDPAVKRLAVEVEPHPLDYANFEGTIPKNQYGAGTVMVWDRGSWIPEGDPERGLAQGHLSFRLMGEKLHGDWHLVRTKGSDARNSEGGTGKQWLLFKSRDEYARPEDGVLEEAPDSVLTGRSLEEIGQGGAPKASLDSSGRKPKKGTESSRRAVKKAAKPEKLAGAVSAPLPRALEPELATLVDSAPEGDDWIHELKFDGYRVLARIDRGKVQLLTRTGKDWTARMPELAEALSGLGVDRAIIDGEVVAMNERGLSDFQLLQNSLGESGSLALLYYVFDLPYLNGVDLRNAALVDRKAELSRLLENLPSGSADRVRLSEHLAGNGPAFFAKACKLGVEGIVSKRAASPYRAGRGRDWLKVKCTQEQEFVIIGFTDPKGSRGHIGALALGTRRGDALVYSGRVGTGFSQRSLDDLHRRLKPLVRKQPPLREPPRGADARGVHWVEPELVAEVAFLGFTEDGLLRHPTFRGLREDKPAREVELERPAAPAPARPPPAVRLTHPDKILYPELGITKRELLDYYASVADRLLPQVRNRPLTLVRCPEGRGKPCFFQKHPGPKAGDGIRTIDIREKKGTAPYAVIDDEVGLFSLVQLGVLEIHTWGSRADDFERPDLIVLDLDPDPSLPLREVIDAAERLRSVFESLKLESFVKTTGGKGLHVCVPIAPSHEWDQIKAFSQSIADELVNRAPEKFVATQSKAKRHGKIFIDYLRNARGATFIAPYSTRARENAPVATPLEWDELDALERTDSFTLRNLPKRLARLARDPFERLNGLAQRLPTS